MKKTTYLINSSVENNSTCLFIQKIALEDRDKYIWEISDKSLVLSDFNSFKTYIKNDFGNHYLYLAYKETKILGLFGLLNVSNTLKCADFLIWIDKNIRNNIILMQWFIQFLLEAQKNNIYQLHAKIKIKNTISLKASERFGFQTDTSVPDRFKKNEVYSYVTRSTTLNSFEQKYTSRYKNIIV